MTCELCCDPIRSEPHVYISWWPHHVECAEWWMTVFATAVTRRGLRFEVDA